MYRPAPTTRVRVRVPGRRAERRATPCAPIAARRPTTTASPVAGWWLGPPRTTRRPVAPTTARQLQHSPFGVHAARMRSHTASAHTHTASATGAPGQRCVAGALRVSRQVWGSDVARQMVWVPAPQPPPQRIGRAGASRRRQPQRRPPPHIVASYELRRARPGGARHMIAPHTITCVPSSGSVSRRSCCASPEWFVSPHPLSSPARASQPGGRASTCPTPQPPPHLSRRDRCSA